MENEKNKPLSIVVVIGVVPIILKLMITMARHYIWSYHFIVPIVGLVSLDSFFLLNFRLIHSQIIFLMRVQQHYRHILCRVPCRLLCSIKCMSMSDERKKRKKDRMKGAGETKKKQDESKHRDIAYTISISQMESQKENTDAWRKCARITI